MTVATPSTTRSCPIHFRNEINKIVILNLENINVSCRRRHQRAGRCIWRGYTRNGASPAPVKLGDGTVAMGRALRPNRLMGLQLSAAAVTASSLAELRSFCPRRISRSFLGTAANRPEAPNVARSASRCRIGSHKIH